MGLTLISPASESGLQAVTTADCKAHLRVTHSDDDTYIAALAVAASVYVSVKTARALIASTYDYTLNAFADPIEMPWSPLTSVTSIKYYDTDGNEQTLSSSVYSVYTDTAPGLIRLAYGQSWPSVRSIAEAITIRFECGYATVPAGLQHAVKLLVSHWYEHREAVDISNVMQVATIPMAFESLTRQFQILNLR